MSQNERIDLNSPEMVYGLLFYCLEEQMEMLVEAREEYGDFESLESEELNELTDKYIDQIAAHVEFLTHVLSGYLPEMIVSGSARPKELAKRLRLDLAQKLADMPSERRAVIQNDEDYICLAMHFFLTDGMEMMMEFEDDPSDDMAEAQAKVLHEYVQTWAEKIADNAMGDWANVKGEC